VFTSHSGCFDNVNRQQVGKVDGQLMTFREALRLCLLCLYTQVIDKSY